MKNILTFLGTHKLALVLALALIYLLLPSRPTVGVGTTGMVEVQAGMPMVADSMMVGRKSVAFSNTPDRLVSKETSLSLAVKDVRKTLESAMAITTSLGGYMIDSSVSTPEEGDSATLSLRVPSDKLMHAMSSFRGLSVKVVSEYQSGTDVTDQYSDLDEQLRILSATKTKFENILNKATLVSDMLEVQRELLSLQQQIDSIKGQQKYLDGTTSYSRITIYLSTDELALPYAPSNSFRPALVWKEAVRSLYVHARSIATYAIWAVVYSPVILVAVFALWTVKKKMDL